MHVGVSLPLPIIHILTQLKVCKIKFWANKAEVSIMVKMWVAKLNVGVMKVLNFKIQFSQITAKITIMVI